MAGEYGGAAFVIIYLFCIFLIGIPVLQSELIIGRRGNKSPDQSFADLARKEDATPRWRYVGYLGAISCFIIMMFYSVVGGWSLFYIVGAVSDSLGKNAAQISAGFTNLTEVNWQANIIYHSIFLFFVAATVIGGIRQGIERVIGIIMPAMFILLIGLVIYATTLPGFGQALTYLFSFDINKLAYSDGVFSWGRIFQVALSAMGHAFFTLSVGISVMIAYASHLPKNVSIPNTAFTIGIIDTFVALIAGITVYSIVFSDPSLAPNAGPGLVFMSIPQAFLNIPGGYYISIGFFTLLWLAAWSSAMSILEPQVEVCMSLFKQSRKVTTFALSIILWAAGLIPALSYNLLADYTINQEPILDFLSNLTDKVMLPLTGLLVAIFSGWIMGMNSTTKELGGFTKNYIYWRVCVRIFVPIAIGLVFVFGIKDWLF
jgi:NSS family neurotransmitter:Na+ symporter